MKKAHVFYRIISLLQCAILIVNLLCFPASALDNDAGNSGAGTSMEMLHTEGGRIVTESGKQITWRGTNLGAWLLQEAWASPLGTGAIDPVFISSVEGKSTDGNYTNITDSVKDVIKAENGTEAPNYNTTWQSGGVQGYKNSELKITLDKPRTFNSIVLETGLSSAGDYLRGGFVTYCPDKSDQSKWVDVTPTIDDSKKEQGIIILNLPDITADIIAIMPTEDSGGSWWTVANVSVCMSDEYTVRTSLFRRFGEDKANELFEVYQDNWITTTDLDNIQAMGMNFVRVPFYWMDFVYATDMDNHQKYDFRTDDGNGFNKLDWLLSECSKRGIYCLLDFHGVPGGSCAWASGGQAGTLPTEFFEGSNKDEYQEVACKIWKAVASKYKDNPTVGGYNLVNEAVQQYSDSNPQLEYSKYGTFNKLYEAIREVDANHIVVFEDFLGYSNAEKYMAEMGYTNTWTNYMFDTHPYDMDNWFKWQSQTDCGQGRLNLAAQYQEKLGVPMLIGEFNLYYHLDVWDDFLAGCNEKNVSWSNWTYKVRRDAYSTTGGNWAYFNSYSEQIPDNLFGTYESIKDIWSKVGTTTSFTRNDGLINVVTPRAKNLPQEKYVELDRTGWTATASHSSINQDPYNPPEYMIDNDWNTRWSSGAQQAAGMWIQIDMGASQTFSRVEMHTSSDGMYVDGETLIGDCPMKYKMQVSDDGTNFTDVALNNTDMGFGDKMVL